MLNTLIYLLCIITLILVWQFKDKIFNNTSKYKKVAGDTNRAPSSDLVGIDEIREGLFIIDDTDVYTGTIESDGVPYYGLTSDERDSLNAKYVNMLNVVNFGFSKHIMSKRKDKEKTEKIYYDQLERKQTAHNEVILKLQNLKANASNYHEEDYQKELKRLKRRDDMLKRDIDDIKEQIHYMQIVSTSIESSSKRIYYSTSGELDSEALKGLDGDSITKEYSINVTDRLNVISNSLKGMGIRSERLDDIVLYDLARSHYKPSTSNVFKTHHLMEEANTGEETLTNVEIFARVKVNEALKKAEEGASNET